MNSNFLSLNQKDFIKGFLVSIVTTILTLVYQCISINDIPQGWEDWKPIVLAGIGSGIAYLLKNLFSAPVPNIEKKDEKPP